MGWLWMMRSWWVGGTTVSPNSLRGASSLTRCDHVVDVGEPLNAAAAASKAERSGSWDRELVSCLPALKSVTGCRF